MHTYWTDSTTINKNDGILPRRNVSSIKTSQDNERAHKCAAAMVKKLGYQLLPHPTFFPDFAHSG